MRATTARPAAPRTATVRKVLARTAVARAALAIAIVVAATAAFAPLGAQVADRETHGFLLFDQAERRAIPGEHPLAWNVVGWIGGDFNRLWIRSHGAHTTRGGGTEATVDLLYGRLVAPFWDALVGAQVDTRRAGGATHTRVSAVASLEGIAPYWFALEPSVFVSDRGDVAAELTATYELFVTQRLIAQPRVDLRAAVQEVRDFGVGSGLNDAGVGVRLRYEIRREFAPYVGVQWTRSFAGTATLARAAGEPVQRAMLVAGVRTWF